LYFLDSGGGYLEVLQFATLEVLIDQAEDIVGVRPDEWKVCSFAVPPAETFDIGTFLQ
jgi:hypothetical protein